MAAARLHHRKEQAAHKVCTRYQLTESGGGALPENIINDLDAVGLTDRLVALWEEQSNTDNVLMIDVSARLNPDEKGYQLRFVSSKPADEDIIDAMAEASTVSDADDPISETLRKSPTTSVHIAYTKEQLDEHFEDCVYTRSLQDLEGCADKNNYGCLFIRLVLEKPMKETSADAPGGFMSCEPWLSRRISRHGVSTHRTDTPFRRCPTCRHVSIQSSCLILQLHSSCTC